LGKGPYKGTARVWSLETGKEVRAFQLESPVNDVALTPDGRYLVTGDFDAVVQLWEFATGKVAHRFKVFQMLYLTKRKSVDSVAFSPDGRYILFGGTDKTAVLLEARTGKAVEKLNGHNDQINSVAFSPNGRHALTGSKDRSAILWEASTGKQVR